jgi:hypothetical protein
MDNAADPGTGRTNPDDRNSNPERREAMALSLILSTNPG